MSNPNPPSGGPPLRALAMVLIALAIVFAGLGAMALSSSSTESAAAQTADTETSESAASSEAPTTTSQAPVTTAPSTTAAPSTTLTTTAPTTTPAAPNASAPVRVLNNSTVSGLASQTGAQLRQAGFTVAGEGNFAAQAMPKTTVYYGDSPGERETAQAVAAELGVSAQPRIPALAGEPAGVIVILTGR